MKNELPTFLDKLKSVIDDQQCEVERAIIGRGKYELCKQYKKLEKNRRSMVYEDDYCSETNTRETSFITCSWV